MKVTFFTTKQPAFYGINEIIKQAANQAGNQSGNKIRTMNSPLTGDTFTPESTVIIEHYHAAPDENSKGAPYRGRGNGEAVADAAVAGVTTGSAVEGTKSVAEKLKGSKGNNTAQNTQNDDTPVDMSDESAAKAETKDASADENSHNTEIDSDTDISSEESEKSIEQDTDVDTDTDIDNDPDIDVDPEPDVDVDTDPDVDVDPDIDIDPDIDPDIDIDVDIL